MHISLTVVEILLVYRFPVLIKTPGKIFKWTTLILLMYISTYYKEPARRPRKILQLFSKVI